MLYILSNKIWSLRALIVCRAVLYRIASDVKYKAVVSTYCRRLHIIHYTQQCAVTQYKIQWLVV